MLFRGMLVSLPEGRGVGKLEGVDGDTCSVAIFRSIIQSETVQFPVSDLTRAYLSPQTRFMSRTASDFGSAESRTS